MKRKFNWVDALVLILILAAVAVFFGRHKLTATVAPSNRKNIMFVVEAKEVGKDLVTELHEGDRIYSQYRLQNAHITSLKSKPTVKSFVTSEGVISTYEDHEEIIIEAVIEAEVAFSGPYHDLGGQEIKAGIPFILKTTDVELYSDIKHVEGRP
ncbi:MAG: DUF4330 domain-containing protein [Gudongella sp.]|jgi:hypothetical protein|nr:DUF4330 domain-containing protein [Gudongella sp.]